MQNELIDSLDQMNLPVRPVKEIVCAHLFSQ